MQAALPDSSPHPEHGGQPSHAFWMDRFAQHYRAAEEFTAFALLVRAAEAGGVSNVYPHTVFGAARFLLLRLLQVLYRTSFSSFDENPRSAVLEHADLARGRNP